MERWCRFSSRILVVLVAVPLFAACELKIAYANIDHGVRLSWDLVPGANQYYLDYSPDEFATAQRQVLGPNAKSVDFVRTVSWGMPVYEFHIIALNDKDSKFEPCVGEAYRGFTYDNTFRKAVSRIIVPIVASTAGQNGAQFKTSLRLTALSAASDHGKIIFHPAGESGSDADPSIPYAFSRAGQTLDFDDIVGAFGRTGVGSLDIVPDLSAGNAADNVPIAEAHLFNQTSSGTFGSFEHHVQPIDFLNTVPLRVQAAPSSQLRVNIGFRTITTATVNFDVFDANNEVRLHRSLTYPINYTLLTTPEELLGTSLGPGEAIVIAGERGSAVIPFYTYTDNGTNDPTLFLPEFSVKASLGPYDLPGIVTIK